MSALYFKAPWENRFDPAKTTTGAFLPQEGRPLPVPMMQGKIRTRFTDWPNGVKALALDFQGGALTFLALLPPDTNGLGALEASLTPDFLRAVNAALHVESVDVSLPRFAIEAGAAPVPLLKGLGVDTLFREADFSRMTAERELAVSTMNHKVSVAVDETGAEGAAAASAVIMTKSALAPRRFIADRPFVFLIVHRESLAPLMVARLASPGLSEEVTAKQKGTSPAKAAEGAPGKVIEMPASATTAPTRAQHKPVPPPLKAATPIPATTPAKKVKPAPAAAKG